MSTDFTWLSKALETIKLFVGDAVIDTLVVIPFLFITYLILEFMEHRMSEKALARFEKAGPLGPIIGSILGVFPQCGFSSAAATFYAGRVITIGTLYAVFMSTSDEMIPIFIAGGIQIQDMIILIAIKFIIGIIIGFSIDAFIKIFKLNNNRNNTNNERYEIHKLCERDQCSCNHHHDNLNHKILRPALLHTFQVTIFVFIITLLLNIFIEYVGGYEVMSEYINTNKYLSVIATSLIGLIPNCASSVAISQLYVDGILGYGALLAGLLDATGVGFIVLFRNNRPMKQNLIIVLSMFCISVIIGLITTIIVG